MAHHYATIAADTDLNVHPIIADNAAQRETVTVPKAMFLPFSMISFVAGRKLSVTKMSKVLYEWADSQGVVAHYTYVWDFLRASSTLSGVKARLIIAHTSPGRDFLG